MVVGMLNILLIVWLKAVCPDLLVCCNGYFVAVEVKAKNGKPSELQLYNRETIRKAGGYAIILYPDKWEEFKIFIENLKNKSYLVDFNDQKLFDKKGGEDNEKI